MENYLVSSAILKSKDQHGDKGTTTSNQVTKGAAAPSKLKRGPSEREFMDEVLREPGTKFVTLK